MLSGDDDSGNNSDTDDTDDDDDDDYDVGNDEIEPVMSTIVISSARVTLKVAC